MSDSIGTTLSRFVHQRERDHPDATGELSSLLEAIGLAGRLIGADVRKAGLAGVLGLTGKTNVQGEQVQKLDVLANEAMIASLEHLGATCVLASEEMEEALPTPSVFGTGDYAVAFDPLDGSGNIDTNMPVGTIFGIYKRSTGTGPGTAADFLRCGREQVAAGYILFGASSMLVYSSGQGVNGFTLDPSVGAWLLSNPDMRIPERGKQYLVNTGNRSYWSQGVQDYVAALESCSEEAGRPMGQRYVGALVADFHRVLLKGGIFMYPADSKDPAKPNGKLRMLYECAPMAMLAEQAGGAASDGHQRILDIEMTSLHQRTALFIGSRDDVAEAVESISTSA